MPPRLTLASVTASTAIAHTTNSNPLRRRLLGAALVGMLRCGWGLVRSQRLCAGLHLRKPRDRFTRWSFRKTLTMTCCAMAS